MLPFIASAKSSADVPFDASAVIWAAIESGQLYLYSLSLFGTIIWLCVEDVSNRAFPPRKYFVLAAILSAFVCVLVYGVDPGLSKPLNPVLVYISVSIYCVFLLMYYALLVFKMLRAPPLGDTLNKGTAQLINQSRRHRRREDD